MLTSGLHTPPGTVKKKIGYATAYCTLLSSFYDLFLLLLFSTVRVQYRKVHFTNEFNSVTKSGFLLQFPLMELNY